VRGIRSAFRLQLAESAIAVRNHVERDRSAVSAFSRVTLYTKRRELFGNPASISFTSLSTGVFVKRPGKLIELVRRVVKGPANQQDFVVLGTADFGAWIAEVGLEAPAANMQVRVALISLPVENIAAGGPDPAADHAVVAEAVFDQVAVVGAEIG